jgi:hypothetical protein
MACRSLRKRNVKLSYQGFLNFLIVSVSKWSKKIFCLLTIFGVVGNKVILDGEQICVHYRCIIHLRTKLIAEAAQRCVECNCSSVVGLETAILIKITIILPRYGKLLRQATESPCPVYPKVSAPVAIQSLSLTQKKRMQKNW